MNTVNTARTTTILMLSSNSWVAETTIYSLVTVQQPITTKICDRSGQMKVHVRLTFFL